METLLALAALLMSGFFSGSETAFLSASRIRIEVLHRRNVRGANLVYRFIKKPESFIVTVLVGNNLVNVLFSSLIVLIFRDAVQDFLLVIIATSLLLIIGEVIPKAIAWEFANHLVMWLARPLFVFRVLFAPVNFLLIAISDLLLRYFKLPHEKKLPNILRRSDIQKYFHESGKFGVIEAEEREIISRIFDLRDTRVKETMVPRTEIIAVSIESSIEDVVAKINESGVSRLPIYDGDIDHIVAVVYAKDLFLRPQQLREVIEEIFYVPGTKSAFDLLREFQQKKVGMAVVLDEYGGTAGIVTLEDLIEELFGEIYDEFDLDHEPMYLMESEKVIKVVGQAEVDELNQKFHLDIPEGNYTTIGGYVIDHLGRIPHANEAFETERFKLVIEKASRRRVIAVKLIMK